MNDAVQDILISGVGSILDITLERVILGIRQMAKIVKLVHNVV
jgi:hypothetical protein